MHSEKRFQQIKDNPSLVPMNLFLDLPVFSEKPLSLEERMNLSLENPTHDFLFSQQEILDKKENPESPINSSPFEIDTDNR